MPDVQLERIEKKLDALTDHVGGVDRRVTAVDGRLKRFGEEMAAGFKRLEAKVDSQGGKIDSLGVKVDSLADTQIHVNSDLSGRVQKHEQRIAALEKRKQQPPRA